jgi:hypothetical protein
MSSGSSSFGIRRWKYGGISISRTCKDDPPPATSHSDKWWQPIARCGYADYAVVDEVFAIARPTTARRTAAE